MHQKTISLVIIAVIYVLAFLFGLMLFRLIRIESLILSVLLVNVSMTFFIFVVGHIIHNSSLYDPYWSVIPPVILIFLSFDLGTFLNGPVVFMNTAILFWSIRLTYNWCMAWTGFNYVDWRYIMIKNRTKRMWTIANFLGIHLFPTLMVYLQLIGAIYVIQQAQSVQWLTVFGALIIVLATMIQGISDQQLRAFKADKTQKERIIQTGLWKYSRHPNYLGEVFVWVGLYLIYLSWKQSIDVLVLMPLLMLFMFLFISIPMMEKKILLTRPEYREYQARVSKLFPIPKSSKKESSIEWET